jgi:long-chain acyl-CoA synthetase
MNYKTLGEMFLAQAEKHTDKTLFWVKADGAYQPITWGEARTQVLAMASALKHLGYTKEDKVAIIAENRYEWAITDLSILCLGMTDVPIYPTNLAEQCEYILEHSESKTVVISSQLQLDKVLSMPKVSQLLTRIITMDKCQPSKKVEGIEIVHIQDIIKLGKENDHSDAIHQQVARFDPVALATIIYTSGTTGEPKGVCLSHSNFLSNIEGTIPCIPLTEEDRCLSFLPLSHVFERMAGYYLFLHRGAEIAYAENMETIAMNMGEIKPTIVLGVPRFYEKLYARIQTGIDNAPALRRTLIKLAIDTNASVQAHEADGKTPPMLLRVAHKFLNNVVLKKLKGKLGGRLRYFCSGGAPLSPEISEAFAKLGLLILQGYGLTESSPVITIDRIDHSKPASVGPPIGNVELKFASDGEILSRGPNIMQGYYKNQTATDETIDSDGWLHTGDIGHQDEEGYLYITDRKKDIIVTSGGKNIAPAKIENMLKNTPLIENALIIGDRRKYISALIIPDPLALKAFATKQNLNPDLPNLLEHPLVQKALDQCVQDVNTQLPSFEKIKKFHIISEDFSIESGDLTPTMKIKKKKVALKYKPLIDAMYQ